MGKRPYPEGAAWKNTLHRRKYYVIYDWRRRWRNVYRLFLLFNQETGELFNYKDSSTPADPSRAIVKGVQDVLEIKKAAPEEVSYLAHGTTVGTNALIEKKGCRLGLITTKGI